MSQENNPVRAMHSQGEAVQQKDVSRVSSAVLPVAELKGQVQRSTVGAQGSTAYTATSVAVEQNAVKNEHYNTVSEEGVSQANVAVARTSQSSMSSASNDSEQIALESIKSWGPVPQWNDAVWQKFKDLVESGIAGEDFMKALGFKRRKELESVFYNLSKYCNYFYQIAWGADFENGEHALPDLKSSKDGLRISNIRFKRYGIDITPNTYFKLTKVSETKIELAIIR